MVLIWIYDCNIIFSDAVLLFLFNRYFILNNIYQFQSLMKMHIFIRKIHQFHLASLYSLLLHLLHLNIVSLISFQYSLAFVKAGGITFSAFHEFVLLFGMLNPKTAELLAAHNPNSLVLKM